MINKDTILYGSFSTNPGNNGCKFFNELFKKNKINAIYKSFYSNDLQKSITSAKHLGFGGFALSMPFKVEVIPYLDELDESVKEIGACNTVKIIKGKLKGYNTDWIGVREYFKNIKINSKINILGNGGFSKSAQYAFKELNYSFKIITRDEWSLVPQLKGIIFNCTPVEVKSKNPLIDGRPFTKSGKEIALLQAQQQYKIYTDGIS
jgi:shikimate 5-dehydrogenase